ncbi:glycosyltransferase [Sorangium sp. So ce281]|uniref:glycosyltransferase n=1 Tax=unclassified Sorangium TaxID=2621164 RepID=UPI003F626687
MVVRTDCGIEARDLKDPRTYRRLAIAHVVSSFQTGGAEQVVVDLAASQRAAGHDVLAVAIAEDPDGPRAEQLRRRGVEVRLVPKCPGFDAALTARLAALFATKGVTLVHAHNHLALVYAAPAGWLHRVPVIHTKHGVSQDMQGRSWLLRAASAFVDAHVAVSQPTAAVVLGRREVDPPKLHVVVNGIDRSRFAPDPAARARVRADLAIPRDAWVVPLGARLSGLHANPARAAQMGRSGRRLALRRYSAIQMAERYMELYALLLLRHSRRVAAVRPSTLLARIWGADQTPRATTAAPLHHGGRALGDHPSSRSPAPLAR